MHTVMLKLHDQRSFYRKLTSNQHFPKNINSSQHAVTSPDHMGAPELMWAAE